MKTILLSLLAATSAYAQAPAGDCFIDHAKLPFEQTTGYKILVARDGTEFNAAEKAVFDQIAALLPASYLHMRSLTDFERVPDGYVIDNGSGAGGVGEYENRGWRIGGLGRTKGHISLTNQITAIQTKDGRYTGDYYFTIVHEMSHAFDFLQDEISSDVEWTGLSTWGTDGLGTSKNFVTWYAPTSPSEDFAESMAYFILDPDTLLDKAPTKFEYISKNFFGGKKYDARSLRAQYDATLGPLSGAARDAKIKELRYNDYYACKILPRP
ncbi:MAG: hypothetical protein JST80_10055 [Bdellovibrionales bacterium]|nr:hypothetical protein [Bdellovibrionales bacterium]